MCSQTYDQIINIKEIILIIRNYSMIKMIYILH
jgi:hypothetical protein